MLHQSGSLRHPPRTLQVCVSQNTSPRSHTSGMSDAAKDIIRKCLDLHALSRGVLHWTDSTMVMPPANCKEPGQGKGGGGGEVLSLEIFSLGVYPVLHLRPLAPHRSRSYFFKARILHFSRPRSQYEFCITSKHNSQPEPGILGYILYYTLDHWHHIEPGLISSRPEFYILVVQGANMNIVSLLNIIRNQSLESRGEESLAPSRPGLPLDSHQRTSQKS
jgi:hypothetical protein